MTEDAFAARLPELTNNPMPLRPPYVFNNMSVRVFPLRASLAALQQLCDGYLNFVPPEVGYFRASAPYVMLMVLDYGQVSEAVSRVGWFSQLEVFFSIQVEWYKRVNGRWVFHDWAVITPYIFVNDTFSVPLGRTIYGFPKILANVTWSPSGWIRDPVSPTTLARVETAVFPDAYAGRDLENKVFLDIEKGGPIGNARVPVDPRMPILPWNVASNVSNSLAGFGRDWMWMAQSMRNAPVHPVTTPGILPQMLARFLPSLSPSGQGFVQNSLNLKQFRGAEDPDRACYQALTNGRMITTGFNGAGMLGEEWLVLGDSSGGHTIKLYQHSSLPIARTLGLEIHRKIQADDTETEVDELKPLLPFWMDLDVRYEQGLNIAWRLADGVWRDGAGEAVPTTQPPEPKPYFNNAVSSAVETVSGPFLFPDATTRVLPLLARRDRLQAFVDDYIGDAIAGALDGPYAAKRRKVRLRVWSRPAITGSDGASSATDHAYVYLTSTHYNGVISKTDNVGNWAKDELSFLVPVLLESCCNSDGACDDNAWEVEGAGLVPAYSFVDGSIAAASRFEIQGIDARKADFFMPKSGWLAGAGPDDDTRQPLLRMDAEVWPAYGAGQKAIIQPVVEVSRLDYDGGLQAEASPDSPRAWAQLLRKELQAKKTMRADSTAKAVGEHSYLDNGRALALEILGNQVPLSLYTLKQFRDVRDPDKACFQQLVRVPRAIRELVDLREMEETLVVRIHDYPSMKIVESLGIEASAPNEPRVGVTYVTQAVRPFALHGSLEERLAEPVMTRAGGSAWTVSEQAFQTLLSSDPGAPPLRANVLAEELIDEVDPSNVAAVLAMSKVPKARADAGPVDGLMDKAAARQAVLSCDPQSIIDSILSREWGNRDDKTRWRLGRQALEQVAGRLTAGGAGKSMVDGILYQNVVAALASRPGAVSMIAPGWLERSGAVLSKYQLLTTYRTMVEQRFEKIEGFGVLGAVTILADYMFTLTNSGGIPVSLPEPPTEAGIREEAHHLLASIGQIADTVTGSPSSPPSKVPQSPDLRRLRELLLPLRGTGPDGFAPNLFNENSHPFRHQLGQFRELVELARKVCDQQREEVHLKFARAFQKPDFCLRRDAVGSYGDELFDKALAWDDDWYYGDTILAGEPSPALRIFNRGEITL